MLAYVVLAACASRQPLGFSCLEFSCAVGDEFDRFIDDMQAEIIEEARKTHSEEVVRRWLEAPHWGRVESHDAHAKTTGPCGDLAV